MIAVMVVIATDQPRESDAVVVTPIIADCTTDAAGPKTCENSLEKCVGDDYDVDDTDNHGDESDWSEIDLDGNTKQTLTAVTTPIAGVKSDGLVEMVRACMALKGDLWVVQSTIGGAAAPGVSMVHYHTLVSHVEAMSTAVIRNTLITF